MTYEEAIEILQEEHDYCQEMSYVIKALEMAIEALEKRIPKKPYWEYGGCHCKSCGFDVLSDEYFCPLCGQAIDWEENE